MSELMTRGASVAHLSEMDSIAEKIPERKKRRGRLEEEWYALERSGALSLPQR